MVEREKIKLLVIEPNALIRQTLNKYFIKSPNYKVICSVSTIKIALEKAKNVIPDIVVFDCVDYTQDDILIWEKKFEGVSVPVLFFSMQSEEKLFKLATLLRCLDWMKIDKPDRNLERETIGLLPKFEELLWNLVLSSRVPIKYFDVARPTDRMPYPNKFERVINSSIKKWGKNTAKIISIGASTGGTTALLNILSKLPKTTPGILVVIHMPGRFIGAFAKRLNEHCQIDVFEAQDNQEVKMGQALVAPGDRHLRIQRTRTGFITNLAGSELQNGHCPSVDVLFDSVAAEAGGSCIGVLLTGMGKDGAMGLVKINRCGGITLVQDEKTSVVFGMAKSAIELGGVQNILPLNEIPEFLKQSRYE